MKRNYLGRAAIAAALLALASGSAWAGIANTKHNLGSNGTGSNTFTGTAEICVFCHTPHGADVSDPQANPPLWNRVIAGTTYTTYDSLGTSTLDGQVLSVGSVSISCLSCHDGTQAMNVMINAPGSGNFDPAGFTLTGTWSQAAQLNDTTKATSIGQDLQNDHPIGIAYGGGGCQTVVAADGTCAGGPGGITIDPDFQDATKSAGLWFVDVDTDGAREKTDMILYTRTFTAGDGPSVECASCHDPHTETPTFLRISNDDSAVCLACHVK